MREARLQVRLAVAVAATMLAQFAISTTTTLVAARMGVPQLAGVTLGMGAFLLLFLAALGVVTAVTPLAAAARRRGDDRAVRLIGQGGVWIALFASVPATLALLALRPVLSPMVGPQEGTAMSAYLTGAAWGLPAWTTWVAVRCLALATGRVGVTTAIMLASVGLHAVLSPWLAFGGLGMPPLGPFGAGLAHALTGIGVLCLLAMVPSFSRRNVFAATLRPPFVLDRASCRTILRLGVPLAARIVLVESAYPVASFVLVPFGARTVAAHAVALRLFELAGVLSFGFNEAAVVRVGLAHGGCSSRPVRHAAWSAVGLATTASLLVAALVAAGRWRLAAWMLAGGDAGIVPDVAALLPLAACLLVADSVQSAAGGALAGLQDARWPLLVATLGTWGVGVPAGLLLAWTMPVAVEGLWCGLILGNLLVGCAYLHRLRGLITEWSGMRDG